MMAQATSSGPSLPISRPAGLDLGGEGPEEVAWAIIGEVLAVRNGRRGGFLKDRRGPIHGRPLADESVGPAG